MKKFLITGISCSLFLSGVFAQTTNISPAAPTPDPFDSVQLKPMDKLLFAIAEDPKPGGPQPVAVGSAGRLIIPVSRDSGVTINIDVRGKTLAEVKDEIRTKLNKDYYYKATIQLMLDSSAPRKAQAFFNGGGTKTSILSFDAADPPTLFEATLQVGLTEYAKKSKIKINRLDPETKKAVTITVNLEEAEKDRSKDVKLQDGDRITIKENWFNIR